MSILTVRQALLDLIEAQKTIDVEFQLPSRPGERAPEHRFDAIVHMVDVERNPPRIRFIAVGAPKMPGNDQA